MLSWTANESKQFNKFYSFKNKMPGTWPIFECMILAYNIGGGGRIPSLSFGKVF